MAKYNDALLGKATRHDREYFSYKESNGEISKRVSVSQEDGETIDVNVSNKQDFNQGSIIHGVEYDTVTFSYPDQVTEIYRYYSGGAGGQLVATVTATFQTNSKKNLLSLVRT